jgi:hypothetical protein
MRMKRLSKVKGVAGCDVGARCNGAQEEEEDDETRR